MVPGDNWFCTLSSEGGVGYMTAKSVGVGPVEWSCKISACHRQVQAFTTKFH